MHTLTSDPPGKLCGSAGEILNGQFLYTGVEFGDTATAVCDQGSVNASCTTRAHTHTKLHAFSTDGAIRPLQLSPGRTSDQELFQQRLGWPRSRLRRWVWLWCGSDSLDGCCCFTPARSSSETSPVTDCEEPPVVKDADMEGREDGAYTYGNVVRYSCRVGTLVGQQDVWCTDNGTWSAAPTCKRP